jgi:hypothetical protein
MTELVTMVVLAANVMSTAIFAKSFGGRALARIPTRNGCKQVPHGWRITARSIGATARS